MEGQRTPASNYAPFLVILLLLLSTVNTGIIATPAEDFAWWPTNGRWLETHVLTPQGPASDFGAQVAIDGDTLVVSTQVDFFGDDWITCRHLGFDDGCDWVYVYTRDSDGTWNEVAKLVPDDAREKDSFGFSVAVDEDSGIIVVGNPAKREQGNSAYIFDQAPDGTWAQTAMFDWPAQEDPWQIYALSVAVSGHTVAVTGPAETFVYEKEAGEWVQTAALPGGGGPLGIALAGDTLVNRAWWQEHHHCAVKAGKRSSYQIFNRIQGEWVEVARLDPQAQYDNRSQTVGTRHAISDDGKTLVIAAAVDRRVYGAHTEHCLDTELPPPVGNVSVHTFNGAMGAVGSAWVYELVDGKWVQTGDLANPTPNPGPLAPDSTFGISVDVDEGRVAIGSDGDMYNSGPSSGAVFIYGKVGDEWILEAKLRNGDSGSNEFFAYSIGLSESTLVVGSAWNTKKGTVHVFEPVKANEDILRI